ncbi:uncharacterized protein PGTG_12217 [Puccinia graminis f. sp. tritici CRL 75-36-700-3]|uniref:Uncharacterized protein n=1 Tax=Puccinia graminis f. sp. tritici (strain CRL 75-36-700-3 / race SCCL) TaxID=418459 RepID=E3KPM6_PUCGT|nr:uncharacterized protein PGTG_12217 [Puccinia graminis f. sp. tritici CRL 75-36-700-3]EFP86261.1 hypothetical protein PGTG_12217 [Puccinia graminis f. sp. tritici CRL 75-36-700-3]
MASPESCETRIDVWSWPKKNSEPATPACGREDSAQINLLISWILYSCSDHLTHLGWIGTCFLLLLYFDCLQVHFDRPLLSPSTIQRDELFNPCYIHVYQGGAAAPKP